jgi:hypothetical protein
MYDDGDGRQERAKVGEQRALATAAEADIAKLTKANEQEAKELARAEQDLDAIRDSLKGMCPRVLGKDEGGGTLMCARRGLGTLTGDTQEIQLELEAKQKELAPWQDKLATVRWRVCTCLVSSPNGLTRLGLQVAAQMEVAEAEVKLLEERMHATENGTPSCASPAPVRPRSSRLSVHSGQGDCGTHGWCAHEPG